MINGIPFFIGLGMHKSASTWIYTCLYEHPDICIPNKDIHFFVLDQLFQNGYNWYETNILKHYNNESIVGDMSVIYFTGEKTAERIKHKYPDAKLFVCLRQPVERAWSHYIQDLKKGHIDSSTSFEIAMEKDDRYVSFGKYKIHFEQFLKYFDKNQIKVLLFDDLKADPKKFLQGLYEFIGVDSNFTPQYINQKLNKAKLTRYHWIEHMTTTLSNKMKASKTGQFFWWKIKNSGLPRLIRKINSRSSQEIPPLEEQMQENLRKIFEEDITFVKEYLNRSDLSW